MKKIFYITLTLLVLLFLLVWPFFLKVGVKCQSQFGACSSQINTDLSKENGKPLFWAKLDADKKLKNNFLISNYSLQFKLSNILMINIIEKKPVFALVDSSSGKIDLVDINGEVLSTASSTFLPEVSVSGNLPKPGGNVDDSNLFALKIMAGVFEMYQVGSGEIQNDSLITDLPGSVRVIFPIEGDTNVLLGALKLIYTKLEGDLAGKFSQIDLRFKNPVIR